MREPNNIIKYGFMLFLIVLAISSFFINNEKLVLSINSLSIPLFLLSISFLLIKANKIYRDTINSEIKKMEDVCKKHDLKVQILEKVNSTQDLIQQRNNLQKVYQEYAGLSNEYSKLIYLYKSFMFIDKFTILFSCLAIFSFATCLISICGVFSIDLNISCINVLSLALVFFDFFIFDELIKKLIEKKMRKIENKVLKNVKEKE